MGAYRAGDVSNYISPELCVLLAKGRGALTICISNGASHCSGVLALLIENHQIPPGGDLEICPSIYDAYLHSGIRRIYRRFTVACCKNHTPGELIIQAYVTSYFVSVQCAIFRGADGEYGTYEKEDEKKNETARKREAQNVMGN